MTGIQLPPFRKPDTDEPAEFVLRRCNDKEYALDEQFRYVDPASASRCWKVPKTGSQFRTDLASVPDVATWLVPKDGRHTPGALLHDALVRTSERPYEGLAVDRVEADRVFRQAMQHLDVAYLRRWAMWAAVSLGTTAAGRPGNEGFGNHLWRVIRVLFVFGLMAVIAGLGLSVWADLTDRSWAVVPFLDPSGPRLPWMGKRVFLAEAWGALRLTGVVSVATGILALVVRGVGEFLALVSSRINRPQMRALAFSIAAFTLMTLCIPLVTAAIGYGIYHLLEWLVAQLVLPPLRAALISIPGLATTSVVRRLDLLTGPVVKPPLLRLPRPPEQA